MPITTMDHVKAVLGITDTTRDMEISLLIPLVESEYLEIRNKDFDLDDDDAIVYPAGAELVAIDMIGYRLAEKGRSTGMKSESLGDYSYTRDDQTGGGGYPKSITSKIRRFVKFT